MAVAPELRVVARTLLGIGLAAHLATLIRALWFNDLNQGDFLWALLLWMWILSPFIGGALLMRGRYYAAATGWIGLVTLVDASTYWYLSSGDWTLKGLIPVAMPLINWVVLGPVGAALSVVVTSLVKRIYVPSNNSLDGARGG